jgi:DNA-binding CsgD family transcriptional regulator
MFENPEIAFGGSRPMLALIETIYATVQQPELWNVVMEGIAEILQANSAVLIAPLPHGVLAPTARTHPEALNAYLTHYGAINTLSKACDALFPDGTVRYGHIAMPESELLRTEIYNDFMRPYNMHWSMGVNVPLSGLPTAYMSCQRPQTLEAFTERDGMVYETLQPHLRRALMLHAQMAQMQATALGLEAALDAHDHPLLGLDANGRVVFQNAGAEALLRRDDGLRLLQGRLHCTSLVCDKKLQNLLSSTTGRAHSSPLVDGGSLLIRRRPPASPLRLTLSRFDAPLTGQSTPMVALVFLSDPAALPRSRAQVMAALYHLTPTERRIADLLLEGLDAAAVSARLSISLETARFHVKRILARTGTRRQSELLRLMLSLPGI